MKNKKKKITKYWVTFEIFKTSPERIKSMGQTVVSIENPKLNEDFIKKLKDFILKFVIEEAKKNNDIILKLSQDNVFILFLKELEE